MEMSEYFTLLGWFIGFAVCYVGLLLFLDRFGD